MSLFAPIGPPHLLQRLKDMYGKHMLGHYHLVLAHDVAANKESWENLLPDQSVVIIDNSIIELGNPVSPEIMLDALDTFGPNYKRVIVLPDAFDDTERTSTQSAAYHLEISGVVPKDVEFMYVIQGRTLGDIDRAVRFGKMCFQENIAQWIAVPRRIADNMGTRMYALAEVLKLKLIYPELKIHLMGFSNNIQDDIYCAGIHGVEGIDSAVPLRLGQQRKEINLRYVGDQAGSRGTFWEDPHAYITVQTRINLTRVRRAIGNGHPNPHPTYMPTLKEGL